MPCSSKPLVFVGISGGIDSAASVLFLKAAGYRVVGVFLYIDCPLDDKSALERQLGIEIIVCDVRAVFRQKIVEPFLDEYLRGRTPSPCVECNPGIKWEYIRRTALEHGAENWATGHYCRRVFHDGRYYVAKGVDPLKDQSYYLWKLSQEVLEGAIFPLGDKSKNDIYAFMRQQGYHTLVEKRQSMGVCFLGGKPYADLLTRHRAAELACIGPGDLVDTAGRVIGRHNGYPFYTAAQRKGLPIAKGSCVVGTDPVQNRVIVGTADELYCTKLRLTDCLFQNEAEVFQSNALSAKVRGVGVNPDGFCSVLPLGSGMVEVVFDYPVWAAVAGQPLVFYIADRVVGGGYVAG